MPNTYFDSDLTGQQIKNAIKAIHGVVTPENNGKLLTIEAGKIVAKSASEYTDAPVLEPVTITENGTTIPPSGVDGFNSVTVNVQGGGSAVIESLSITQNGTYEPPSGVDGYSPIIVNVRGSEDTYAFIVVSYPVGSTCTASNGSVLITAPDTSGHAVFAIPSSGVWIVSAVDQGQQLSENVSITTYGESQAILITFFPSAYQRVEYLESAGNQSIDTGLDLTVARYFNLEAAFTNQNNNNNVYGLGYSNLETNVLVASGLIYNQVGARNITIPYDTNKHVFTWEDTGISIDTVTGSAGSNLPSGNRIRLFATAYNGVFSSDRISYARMYSCKIYDGASTVRDFVPCYRKSDNKPGMYDLVNNVFYTNDGAGEFILGPEV